MAQAKEVANINTINKSKVRADTTDTLGSAYSYINIVKTNKHEY
ncbi:hypothetical protein [Campylobacter majalis]